MSRYRPTPETMRDAITNLSGTYGTFECRRYLGGCKWEDYTPENGETESYGDFKPSRPEDATHFVPDVLSFSDYSGDRVEVSNVRYIRDNYAAHVVFLSGGYGTEAVAIPLGATDESLIETLSGLSDYPVIDEGLMSEVEQEQIEEAWESWAEYDFKRALRKCFPWADEAIDEMASGDLRELFESTRERINCYWEPDGNGMHVRVEEVADAVPAETFPRIACSVCDRTEDDLYPVPGEFDEYGRCIECAARETAEGIVRDSLDPAQISAL
jgi:hypothetical protein